MLSKSRLIFALAAMLLLSNCGLIGTAIRLAPYALLFADEEDKGAVAGRTMEMRAKEVQDKKVRGAFPAKAGMDSQLAYQR